MMGVAIKGDAYDGNLSHYRVALLEEGGFGRRLGSLLVGGSGGHDVWGAERCFFGGGDCWSLSWEIGADW